jgi:hypothetical protein
VVFFSALFCVKCDLFRRNWRVAAIVVGYS